MIRVGRTTCAAEGFFSSRRASPPFAFGRCRLQVGQALEEDLAVGVGHPDVSLLLPELSPQLGHIGPKRKDQGSGFGRQAAPQVGREWWPIAHSADIAERLAAGYFSP